MIEKEIKPFTGDCCCSEPTPPEQVSSRVNRDYVSEIFAECGKKLGNQARQVMQQAQKRSQELLCRPLPISKPKKLKKEPKCSQGFWKRFSFDELATGILVLMILLILIVGLFLVRSYNQAQSYGTGGCLWPTFWGQCQIMT